MRCARTQIAVLRARCVNATLRSILSTARCTTNRTRHTASTSMYSLTFCVRVMLPERHQWKPAVQAAALMLRTPPVGGRSPASSARTPRRAFALCRHIAGWTQACCHSNATRAPIANSPNSAQPGGSLYHTPKLHPGPCSSVGVRTRTGRQTHTQRQTRVTTIHFASSTTHAKCN